MHTRAYIKTYISGLTKIIQEINYYFRQNIQIKLKQEFPLLACQILLPNPKILHIYCL